MTSPRSWTLPGLAALLAAGLLAVLLAVGASAPASVGAHIPDDNMDGVCDYMHVDFQKTPVACGALTHQDPHEHTIEEDGGRFRDLTFKVYVPSESRYYDSAQDRIEITFDRSFDLLDSMPSMIKVDDSGESDPVDVTDARVDRKTLILTGGTFAAGSSTVEKREYITITIGAGAKIETPETPQGFDDFEGEKPYEVFITFVDGDTDPVVKKKADDNNFVIVKNPIDSTVPNTSVRVELATYAQESISTADDIIVDFSGPSAGSGFDLPSSMSTSRIKVFYDDGGSGKSFNPSEVQIEGDRVIFSVPTDKNDNPIGFMGDYRIEFSKLARVKPPLSAGIKTIKVSSTVDGDEEDIIEAVIRRTTTVSPQQGPRGSEFTLEGKGYAPGTVTVYHDADGDENIDAGETLASVKTVRGAFSTKLTAGGNPGEEQYRVRARDSEGDDVAVGFNIRSSMSFEPSQVSLGSSLKIIISDWEKEHNEIVAVQIAGKQVFVADAVEYANCIDHPGAARRDQQGNISLTVNVPSDIPTGEQTVEVYDHYQLDYTDADGNAIEDAKPACSNEERVSNPGGRIGPLDQTIITDDPIAITKATVEIVAQALTVSPATAVPGQRITITGSGFSRNNGNDIVKVTINGDDVEDDLSRFEVSQDGTVAVTVTVPQTVRQGENEVQLTGWDNRLGTGTLTVPEPAITVTPPQGKPGDRATVRGSGFAANGIVLLNYGDVNVAGGQSDGRGNFEISFPVPLHAAAGSIQRVQAVMKMDGQDDLQAGADHSPPSAQVTAEPDPVLPGNVLTIRGENLPPFALVRPVRFANRDFTPVPNISTDRNGAFEMQIRPLGVELGDQPLRVEVSGVVVTTIVEVALPPLSGPPEQVFRYLINAGVLNRIWYLDSAEQAWSFFDARPEYAEFNTLTQVESGDILWLNLSAPHTFQGDQLYEGWQFVLLD